MKITPSNEMIAITKDKLKTATCPIFLNSETLYPSLKNDYVFDHKNQTAIITKAIKLIDDDHERRVGKDRYPFLVHDKTTIFEEKIENIQNLPLYTGETLLNEKPAFPTNYSSFSKNEKYQHFMEKNQFVTNEVLQGVASFQCNYDFRSQNPDFPYRVRSDERNHKYASKSKLFHSTGATCGVDVIFNDYCRNTHTGMFSEKKHKGYLRCGKKAFSWGFQNDRNGFGNSVALKLFRDKEHPSFDIVCFQIGYIDSIGQNALNYWEQVIGTCNNQHDTIGMLARACDGVMKTHNPARISVFDGGMYHSNGSKVKKPNAPFVMLFVPPKNNELPRSGYQPEDLFYNRELEDDILLTKKEFGGINPGTHLWDIYAINDTNDFFPTLDLNKIKKIGKVVSNTTFEINSKFGNEHVLFYHQDSADDYKYKPHWKKCELCPEFNIYVGPQTWTPLLYPIYARKIDSTIVMVKQYIDILYSRFGGKPLKKNIHKSFLVTFAKIWNLNKVLKMFPSLDNLVIQGRYQITGQTFNRIDN